MDSLVQPRPNHYQVLGLTPAATDDEIKRAFARAISPLRPRSFGSIAELSVALETLRDPVRRRAYDASIGLLPEPAPTRPLQGWRYAGPVRVSRPGLAPIDPPTVAKGVPEERPQSISEAPSNPDSRESLTEADRTRPPDGQARPRVAPVPDWIPAPSVPMQRRVLGVDEEAGEWKRPAIFLGGTLLAVGLMGVIAGSWASRDVQSKAPQTPFAMATPEDIHSAASASPVAAPATPQARQERPARTVAERPAVRHRSPAPKPVAPTSEKAEDVPEIPSEQVAALTSPAEEASAKPPLSKSVVARTIGRIGYSCGQVASTTAVEGAPGAFKVTCTSGQSFKAAPVHGRYHFRRWAGQE